MKKSKVLLNTIILLLCSTVANAQRFEVDGIYYHITDNAAQTVAVSDNTGNKAEIVIIPESVVYNNTTYNVTSIGYSAFKGCSSLTSIEMPTNVTSIEDFAFYDCSSLTSIEMPNGVTNIGELAFRNCAALISIELPNSVTRIRHAAFYGCTGLTSIKIPNGLEIIETGVFWNCTSLTSIEIPNSVTYIGASAFLYCTSLTSIEIPNSVTYIDSSAFDACLNLTKISLNCNNINNWFSGNKTIKNVFLGDSVISIGYSAFKDCTSLTSIEIPNSVTSIGSRAFQGCSGLTSIVLPNNVTSIEDFAFLGCSSLTSIKIPNNVTSIREGAFADCTSLTSIEIPNSVTYFYSGAFNGCYNLTNISLNCNNIGGWFSGNKTIKNIVLGDSVISIGHSAFKDCTSLTSIEISNNVKTIGNNAFYNCTNLTSIDIPKSVTTIGDNAFYGCVLKSLYIGSGILSIGSGQCKPIKTFWLTNTPPSGYKNLQGEINYVANDLYSGLNNLRIYPYLSSFFEIDGVMYVPVSPSERTCDAIDCCYGSNVTEINIHETVSFKGIDMKVQNVMPYMAYGHTFVEDVNLSVSDAIGEYAFNGCSSVATLTLGNSVSSIGASAFKDCNKIAEVILPNAITSLGDYCFSGCGLLSEIKIPSNVKSIGNYTFSSCTGLANVTIEDRTTVLALGANGSAPLFADCPLDSVYIGGNISYNTSKNYGYSPFYRNTSLRTVVITDKEEEISDNEFYGCTNLKKLTIGSDVKIIGNWAFSGCGNLEYFSFGSNVESIGEEAFSDCVNLTKLISNATTPPTCGNQALDDINKWNCVLMIPEGTKSNYQTANQWKDFFFIEEIPTSITNVVMDDEDAPLYNLNGTRVDNTSELQKGIYIKNGKKFFIK